MKLLFVTHWANNMLIFRTWMLQEAVRQGHEVCVLCPDDKEAVQFSGLGVRHIPWILQRGGGVKNLLNATLQAKRIIRAERPDATVVYCVQPIMAMLWAWKLGGGHGKLFPTFTGLGSLWTDMDPPSWKKRMLRSAVERVFGWLLPQAQKVFVLNRDDKAQVTSWNSRCLAQKVEQTKGEGIDLDHFSIPSPEVKLAARVRWGIPEDAKVIGFVGRLIREKGAQDFLKLCAEFQKDPNVHFLVVGDPDPGNPTSLTDMEMQQLEAVPRLHREPWMDDVRPAYAAMDVLVFLSAREGLPITPLEAMAMGVPVIAKDAVGTREVVPLECLVFMNDISGYSNMLEMENYTQGSVLCWDKPSVQTEMLNNILVS